MFPAFVEEIMNCNNCQARIDYNFLTNCAHCGGEIKGASVLQTVPVSDVQFQPRLKWIQQLVNIVQLLASSFAGLILGGVVFYFSFVAVYFAFLSGGHKVPHSCGGSDDSILVLLILSGAYVGMVGGTALALKKPWCKVAAK